MGASFLFLYLFLSLPRPYLLISLFTYFFLSSSFYFFALSLCHSFYFDSIFLEPEPKLFHVMWVNKLHWRFIFYMGCNGKTKQNRQIQCSGVFRLFRCSGCSGVFRVLWGVPECSRVFRCSRVPRFSTCHSFHHFWQCVTKSCKVTIACQTN